MKYKLSKNQWENIGKKAGWIKKAYAETKYAEISIGATPSGEPCAQLGSNNYEQLSATEIKAYSNQIKRMFPDMPMGIRFKKQANNHDFGVYHELAIQFDENNEEAVEYAYRVDGSVPEYWDEDAKIELESNNYFNLLNSSSFPDLGI